MSSEPPYGRKYLQNRIAAEFSLARHMSIEVERADDEGIVLVAPLQQNLNDKGTAFGGSLYTIAVLTGWAWVARYLDATQIAADAVIQEAAIRYLVPVYGELRTELASPAVEHIDNFRKMLRRAQRGRIRLTVQIRQGESLAVQFDGTFAAYLR